MKPTKRNAARKRRNAKRWVVVLTFHGRKSVLKRRRRHPKGEYFVDHALLAALEGAA